MGMILPLMIFIAFLGLNATMSARNKIFTPSVQQSMATVTGQIFIKYRDAVTNYATANPGYTGVVPWPSLAQYLYGGNAVAYSSMSNVISSAQGGGRQIAVYVNGSGGGSATALSQSNYDASIGRVVSGQWTSYSSTATSISVPVPSSGMVSLININ